MRGLKRGLDERQGRGKIKEGWDLGEVGEGPGREGLHGCCSCLRDVMGEGGA